MDSPLNTWYCDRCGEKIATVADGYVIWRSGDQPRDFKIIHQGRCDNDRYECSAALSDFLGPEGLTYCLAFLDAGPIIRGYSNSSAQPLPDLFQFVDFMRRVQIPYYEEARRKFARPDVREDHCDWNEYAPYVPDALKAMVIRYQSEI